MRVGTRMRLLLECMCNFEHRTNEYTYLLKGGPAEGETQKRNTRRWRKTLGKMERAGHRPLLFGDEKSDSAGRRGVRCQEGKRMGWRASGGPER